MQAEGGGGVSYLITAGVIGLAFCLLAVWPSVRPRITAVDAEEDQ